MFSSNYRFSPHREHVKGRTRERRDVRISVSPLLLTLARFRTVTGPRLNFHVSIGGKVKWPLACVRPLIDKSVATLGVSVRASRLRNAPRTAARYSHEKFTPCRRQTAQAAKRRGPPANKLPPRVPLVFLFDLFVDPPPLLPRNNLRPLHDPPSRVFFAKLGRKKIFVGGEIFLSGNFDF